MYFYERFSEINLVLKLMVTYSMYYTVLVYINKSLTRLNRFIFTITI